MRTDDILDELDILTSRSKMRSLDPEPDRVQGMDSRIIKDLIADHIRALKHVNMYLKRSPELESAVSTLELEYEKLLGRRLTEISIFEEPTAKSAVLELRRQLLMLAGGSKPDLSYRNIDRMMKLIAKEHDCTPKGLHDAFISTLLMTPDQWVRDQLSK